MKRIPVITPAAFAAALACTPVHAEDHPAVLGWSQALDLSVPVSGMVERVAVRPGQIVGTGEVLLSLDATVFKAELVQARTDVERLTEEEADASRELERAQELYRRTVSPTTELDAARLRYARARTALAAAQARLEQQRWRLAQAEVRAPYPAIVLERRAEPGMTVASQCQPPALLRIASAEELLVRARLSPAQAARQRIGGEAVVRVAGTRHAGKVIGLAYDGHSDTPYVLEAVIPRMPGLTAGLPATLQLP